MAAAKANVYDMVTTKIIAELEKGIIPWEKPWTGIRAGAYNRVSKKPYSMINQMLLKHTGEYATFKQWLKVLKNDNKFIVSAAGKAEKAVNYILAAE